MVIKSRQYARGRQITLQIADQRSLACEMANLLDEFYGAAIRLSAWRTRGTDDGAAPGLYSWG